jgi:hypothetical protein
MHAREDTKRAAGPGTDFIVPTPETPAVARTRLWLEMMNGWIGNETRAAANGRELVHPRQRAGRAIV